MYYVVSSLITYLHIYHSILPLFGLYLHLQPQDHTNFSPHHTLPVCWLINRGNCKLSGLVQCAVRSTSTAVACTIITKFCLLLSQHT
jgi:hypothetical protein